MDCFVVCCALYVSVGIDVDFQMFNKTSTRLPEALLYVFRPQHSRLWQISKLGRLIDPLNVVLNGSQYQHGVCSTALYLSLTVVLSGYLFENGSL